MAPLKINILDLKVELFFLKPPLNLSSLLSILFDNNSLLFTNVSILREYCIIIQPSKQLFIVWIAVIPPLSTSTGTGKINLSIQTVYMGKFPTIQHVGSIGEYS